MNLDRSAQLALVGEASLAPSVHNVQPARWRFAGEHLFLFEDRTRRLPAGDPAGRDATFSLGAAAEGMAIALSRQGLGLVDASEGLLPAAIGDLAPVRRFLVSGSAPEDPFAAYVAIRQSHRGGFAEILPADRAAALALAGDGVKVIAEAEAVAQIARHCDQAGLAFLRDRAFRGELMSWMRLSRRHSGWHLDGLNADAMAMSRIEALGARFVLGRSLFPLLDRLGLAAALTGETATIRSSAAILLFHRPLTEDPFESGRHFYKLWLRIAASDFQAAVMASLADHALTASALAEEFGIGGERQIVSALRIGRRPAGAGYERARLPADALLV